MKTKTILMLTLAVACTIASVFIASRQKTARPNAVAPAQTEHQPATVPVEVVTTPVPEKTVEIAVATEKSLAKPDSQKQNAGNPSNPKEPLQDPDARAALNLVGADPVAEQYWFAAINDPNLPDQEREDLMEDLNEAGLSDPQHPGLEDLPLIVNRIRIIEEIAPDADEFMLEHLGEAYKDLNNLLAGNPVQ